MIPIETIVVFTGASIALALAPGPDNLFVLTQSALHGRTAGLLVTLGLATGLMVHTAAVGLGVAVVFQTSELAFNMLKMIGALYLIYLAVQAFRAGATSPQGDTAPSLTGTALYGRGIVMNITNPKVAIFFLAFLPQFADPSWGSITAQIMGFGLLFIVSTLVVFGSIALFAGYLGDWLKRSVRAQVLMNRIAGTVFLALALRLMVTQR